MEKYDRFNRGFMDKVILRKSFGGRWKREKNSPLPSAELKLPSLFTIESSHTLEIVAQVHGQRPYGVHLALALQSFFPNSNMGVT